MDNLVLSILYTVQTSIGLFLMLTFMIANWWLCLSILLGLAAGHFVFSLFLMPFRAYKLKNDCCEL